jgi:hypothetical protein
VSLLLSKDQPNTASLTLSPFLRETLGTGTLGADRIHATRITEEQKKDNRCVAKGWKIQNLNTAVDSILASATRLEKEIEVETKYWEQVLAVNEKGWAVCRLPNEKHTLGVRFGFSEGSLPFPSVLFHADHQQRHQLSETKVSRPCAGKRMVMSVLIKDWLLPNHNIFESELKSMMKQAAQLFLPQSLMMPPSKPASNKLETQFTMSSSGRNSIVKRVLSRPSVSAPKTTL